MQGRKTANYIYLFLSLLILSGEAHRIVIIYTVPREHHSSNHLGRGGKPINNPSVSKSTTPLTPRHQSW